MTTIEDALAGAVRGRPVLDVPACRAATIMRREADRKLLEAAGVDAEHLDVSKAGAERVLLPRVRDASPGTAVLAAAGVAALGVAVSRWAR